MSFRGKPSKACERCRARRLKCDLAPVTCGSCLRAKVICTGYRDTEKLRIRDETDSLHRKAAGVRRCINGDDGRHLLVLKVGSANAGPRYLPLALDVQAKELFFDHYIFAGQINGSGGWDFLRPYHQSEKAPVYLQLTIDAASLAYLSHQFGSQKARLIALERYTAALGVMGKVLKSPEASKEITTLFAALLLDLFEKLSTTQPLGNRGWSSHLRGALAISEKCGDQFTTSNSAMRALTRLSSNLLITSLAAGTSLPSGFFRLRGYFEESLCIEVSRNPKWQLSQIMAQYVNLQSNIRNGERAREGSLREARELDCILKTFSDRDVRIKQIFKSVPSRMVYGNAYYSYPDRHSTQIWNIVRLAHVLVVNFLVANATTEMDRLEYLTKVDEIASNICASAPQYLDCMGVVKSIGQLELLHPVVPSHNSCTSHTPSHRLACYTLIFPLYVAGFVRHSNPSIWKWATEKLHHIGSHFGIRNAELVAQILEKRSESDPWKVYALLGSYAFGA
ncbi:hypothetical protein BCIN_02g07610 [Botrytis cinerea B05.10]|uniref:Zn(2)-C6 fungal-type domain-containing protein n=1 Tax=Botryotinia fuckeliana (strain B05.10) TaxID=332648 RepID=A0A384JA25_BOTFB|nr:hypothetical protein BCIN_02g07610 [Botrytis cinerea B05.10]ATZ47485.1 hypothetical protein BCIN_02g07610 [Botrytis cinerea B05.10]